MAPYLAERLAIKKNESQNFRECFLKFLDDNRMVIYSLLSILNSESEYTAENAFQIGQAFQHGFNVLYFEKDLLEDDSLTEDLIQEMNSIILGKKLEHVYADKKRFVQNMFQSSQFDEYVIPELVPFHMKNLVRDLEDTGNIDFFFLNFMKIHPFSDGNGRTCKLLYSLLTRKFPIWHGQADLARLLSDYRKYKEKEPTISKERKDFRKSDYLVDIIRYFKSVEYISDFLDFVLSLIHI